MNWLPNVVPRPAPLPPTAEPNTDAYTAWFSAVGPNTALYVVERTWFVERAERDSWSVMQQDKHLALTDALFTFTETDEREIGYASPSAASAAARRLAWRWQEEPVTWDGRNPVTMG